MHILLVEDNAMNQKIMVRMLQKFGYSSEIANNGQEAVELFSPSVHQIVLMDIQMPIMDGITSAKKILARHTEAIIIALTANVNEDNKRDCAEAGMKKFITKPIDKNILHSTLKEFQKLF